MIPNFPKTYFYASVVGYVIGMCVTLGIMQVFQHAQPALLYLVPGVLISLWLTGYVRGEIRQMWDFSEASEEETSGSEEKGKDAASKTEKAESETGNSEKSGKSEPSWWGQSFFSAEKSERNAKRLEKSLAKNITSGEDNEVSGRGKDSATKDDQAKLSESKGFFSLSIKPHHARKAAVAADTPQLPDNATKHVHRRSSSGLGDAVLITDADVEESAANAPKWRGARVGEGAKEERAEKRLRTK